MGHFGMTTRAILAIVYATFSFSNNITITS
jgi:hypothetical protein